MSKLEDMKTDRVAAMKKRDRVARDVLTVFIGDIESDMKRGTDVDDSYVVGKLKKAIANAKENAKLSNDDSYLVEVEVLEGYLPTMASEGDVRGTVNSILQDSDADHGMGNIMKTLKATYGDALDGKEASAIVRSML